MDFPWLAVPRRPLWRNANSSHGGAVIQRVISAASLDVSPLDKRQAQSRQGRTRNRLRPVFSRSWVHVATL